MSNLSRMPHITHSNSGIPQAPVSELVSLQLVTAFTSLSSACSVSCCVAYFLLSMLPHIILFPCPLMSHPLVCSHNLSPAPTASRSGTWITILVHLAAGDNCCLCSDAELFFLLWFPKESIKTDPHVKVFSEVTCRSGLRSARSQACFVDLWLSVWLHVLYACRKLHKHQFVMQVDSACLRLVG